MENVSLFSQFYRRGSQYTNNKRRKGENWKYVPNFWDIKSATRYLADNKLTRALKNLNFRGVSDPALIKIMDAC